ncbi:putative polysaccharide biosynthesis protein [Peribacillus loiseleuriae]|uniref:Polysaccharide biosynthesis/transport protein n=1 Tax=Peribacillus loiseleuriae TaxID=1679170 RepID=A0A0K9H083_9BACI|nr:polysaccharide biosynthesis protein [Peribacillus loiseleuriae]KMY51922.1 polysaccharide biosynthesis/transport protein [Peribacillus loiseleuriae]
MSRQTFIRSTLILSVATLLSKILGSVFRIPLQNIAGDEVLGIFSLVYPVYMVALTLSVAGIPIAISQLITKARAEKNHDKIKEVYVTASILALVFGILSFSFIFIFSDYLAEILGGPSTKLSLIVVSLTLLVAPYMAVYRGFFQGFENMTPTAISQVTEQLVRVGLILLAAYYLVQRNYSDEVVAAGVMVGSSIGALISLLYLRTLFKKANLLQMTNVRYSFDSFKRWSKVILKISIPICIGAITMALLNFVDSVTVPFALKGAGVEQGNINYLYGIYGRGLSLVQIATVFATSIVLPLIPLITKKLAENDVLSTRGIVEKTHRMTHFISWPAAFGLLALTLPLNLSLFTDLEGSLVLAIIGFSSVFTSLTVLGTGILQGMNLAKLGAYIILFGALLKVLANIFFVKYFELTGAALSTLFVYILLFFINTYYINKKLAFSFIKRETLFMILASLVMGAIIGYPTLTLHIESWSRLGALLYVMVAIVFGVIIYFLQLFLYRVVKKQDIKNFPIIGKFLK